MLLFDLQWLLFGFLLLLVAAVSVAVWLDRRQRRKRAWDALPGAEEMRPVLERAPFGLLVLEGMTQAGIDAGLSEADARRVVAQIMQGTAALVLQTGLSFDKLKALTPMETVDEPAVARLFRAAARTAKEKMDRAQEKLWKLG